MILRKKLYVLVKLNRLKINYNIMCNVYTR